MKKLFKSLSIPMVGAALLALTSGQAQANNLFGIDVSNYQGHPTWSTVKANGAQYAYAKATEGNYFEDGDYTYNMSNGKAAGLQMGPYHFCRPDLNCVSTESNYFWNFANGYIKNDGKTLSPMLDFETYNGAQCQPNYTAWMNTWSSYVKGKTSYTMTPVIYTSACAGACDLISYQDAGGITLAAWIANYNGENLYTGNPWSSCDCCNMWIIGCGTGNWKFWQVCSTGSIGGISGGCDFDAYYSSLTTLKSQIGVH